jgi:ABC-type transporter Mla subunit MlaD
MNKELKEMLEKSSRALEKLQDTVEDLTENLADDASDLWSDMKKNFSGVNEKLKTATKDLDQKSDEANLQAHLGAMEAHDKIGNIKESIEEFTKNISTTAETKMDTAALQAHLAKMEAEDFWEKKGKTLTNDFHESREKVQKLTVDAVGEIKDYFEKLTEALTKKS